MSAPTPEATLAEMSDLVRASARKMPHTTAAAERETWAAFERWCHGTGRNPLPAVEHTLLAYLAERADLAWGSVKRIIGVVNRIHDRHGYQRPGREACRAVLRETARVRGRVAEALVDDLSMAELRAMSRVLRGQPGGDGPALRLSAATAACVLLGIQCPLDTHHLAELWDRIAIDVPPKEVAISVGTARRLLRDRDDPFLTAMFRGAAALKADEGRAGDAWAPSGAALASAWRRAGLGTAPAQLPAGMRRDDLTWLITNIEPDTHRRLRDRAYLLVGVTLALRHEDLAHLRIENVSCDPDGAGYRVYFTRSKADPDGSRPPRLVPHVTTPDGDCDELCPACALRDHLRVVAGVGRSTGYVFATLYAGKWAPMTRQNARLRIRDAWRRTNPTSEKRIASRSCRVTGATLAYDAGMPVAEIAAEVTLHATIDEADRYIRRHHETEFQLTY